MIEACKWGDLEVKGWKERKDPLWIHMMLPPTTRVYTVGAGAGAWAQPLDPVVGHVAPIVLSLHAPISL